VLQDVPSPKPRLLKREFNAGKKSAVEYANKAGFACAAGYFNCKKLDPLAARAVLSYWSGYRAGLESYKEATDD
jgi:hypothetical protein